MKIKYFEDTDTLYIEFRAVEVAETKDLDENTLLDLDADGNICGITMEHAHERTELPKFSYEQITA
jgi:uncharacterized protein YuzE